MIKFDFKHTELILQIAICLHEFCFERGQSKSIEKVPTATHM